jgi:DNA-binding NarL/FixJ family response regulator
MSVTVVVADDHPMVRSGLASVLDEADIKIVGEAKDGDEAVQQTRKHKPDVLLLDIRMPEKDGLEALERIRKQSPQTRVVILSTYDNPTYVARAVALGASNYVLKGSSPDELVSAIKGAVAGEAPAADSLMEQVKGAMARRYDSDQHDTPLTNRELQVLRHVALGLSNKEIGTSLEISVETVKEHVQNILRKIDATDRTQAAVWAVKRGLV